MISNLGDLKIYFLGVFKNIAPIFSNSQSDDTLCVNIMNWIIYINNWVNIYNIKLLYVSINMFG